MHAGLAPGSGSYDLRGSSHRNRLALGTSKLVPFPILTRSVDSTDNDQRLAL